MKARDGSRLGLRRGLRSIARWICRGERDHVDLRGGRHCAGFAEDALAELKRKKDIRLLDVGPSEQGYR